MVNTITTRHHELNHQTSYKFLRRKVHRKRYSHGRTDIPRRQRKPETLQSFRRERLQPWFDLANLLPFEPREVSGHRTLEEVDPSALDLEYLRRAFIERFGQQSPPDPSLSALWALAQRSKQRLSELKRTYTTIRAFLERIPNMPWREDAPLKDKWVERGDVVEFPMVYWAGEKNGKIDFDIDPLLNPFMEALKGADIARFRRCPVRDCGRFYYAARSNAGACHEHLARARVERSRDPERRRQYEQTRKVNRLVKKEGKSIADAKAEVKRRRRKRRTIQ